VHDQARARQKEKMGGKPQIQVPSGMMHWHRVVPYVQSAKPWQVALGLYAGCSAGHTVDWTQVQVGLVPASELAWQKQMK
jgi:hypothetical protein